MKKKYFLSVVVASFLFFAACAVKGTNAPAPSPTQQRQIPDSSGKDGSNRPSPAPLSSAGNPTFAPVGFSAGDRYFCTINQSDPGEIECSGGWNSKCELGYCSQPRLGAKVVDGPGSQSSLRGATRIVSFASQSCVLIKDGTAKCWGANDSGQLGNQAVTLAGIKQSEPVFVTDAHDKALQGIEDLAVGKDFACALVSDSVQCWGANDANQLGDGTQQPSLYPKKVPGLESGVRKIFATVRSACALFNDSRAKCWGEGLYASLGNGNPRTKQNPGFILKSRGSPLVGIMSLALADHHGCASMSDSGVLCWGSNEFGQIGNGKITDSVSDPIWFPTAVVDAEGKPIQNVATLSSGWYHTCAALKSGAALCWGSNAYSQLGNQRKSNSGTPVSVVTQTGEPMNNILFISGARDGNYAISSNGIRRWGFNP